ncbi:hypothetical protein SCOCK_540044 [Actinacidiphila cocklensis]|uniref:Uncharacterized protein n=1 Tax=Actinacidiphila cocklensis TaxID=887465 RepID=A0A9W4EAM4_9ACTN|nr:hypothetical protein SCOCK_540044 [Actinacidiphila cocklensis]
MERSVAWAAVRRQSSPRKSPLTVDCMSVRDPNGSEPKVAANRTASVWTHRLGLHR